MAKRRGSAQEKAGSSTNVGPGSGGANIRSLSGVTETWWDAGGIFACPDTDSFSARCQNREGHSPLAIHTAAFVHVLVLLAAGLALCYGESINLT
jgi:hypothetical protein